jgi:3-oxoadipate enol-lactonase
MIVEARAKDGTTLCASVDGPSDGTALLLLHSIGTDHGMWSAQIQDFSRLFRVVALDARGHGASAAPDGDYTIDRLGTDALAMLDHLGIGTAHVCGLSMGGAIAQWLALHAGDRVKKLVLANTAARIGTVEMWQTRQRSVLTDGMASIADVALSRFFGETFRAAHPETVTLFRDRLTGMSAQGYAGCCAALRDADFRLGVAGIMVPTLVIGGTEDVSTPPAEAEYLAHTIPRAELVLLESAHLSNIEQPENFSVAVSAFLERP